MPLTTDAERLFSEIMLEAEAGCPFEVSEMQLG
jgi:hypothetical protein